MNAKYVKYDSVLKGQSDTNTILSIPSDMFFCNKILNYSIVVHKNGYSGDLPLPAPTWGEAVLDPRISAYQTTPDQWAPGG